MIPDEIRLPGEVRTAELVVGRRGSRVWRVSMADGQVVALKYTTDDGESGAAHGQVQLLAAREAAVLSLLDGGASLHACGATAAGSWLAVTWHEGMPLSGPWRRLRRDDTATTRTPALAATQRAASAVADLHARGWRHADLQADHILINDAGQARLIDLALAQGPAPITPEVTYRGALAHLTAPEIASEVLATPAEHHVTLTAPAEVYTFGGLLFAAWTGSWPRDCGADHAAPLTVAQVHATICQPHSLRPMPDSWPPMAALLAGMLDHAPGNRPTMAEVAHALHGWAGGEQ